MKRVLKNIIKVILILLVIAGLVIGGLKLVKAKRAKEAETPSAKVYSMVVSTMTPMAKPSRLTLPYLAVSKSNDDVKISSRMSARIVSMVANGKKVHKGDILVTLDNQEINTKKDSIESNIDALKAQIDSKQFALNTLQSNHQRTLALLEVQGVSREKSENEESQIAQVQSAISTLEFKIQALRSSLKATQNLMTYSEITAPIDGIVTRLSNAGDVAMPGKPLVSIGSNSNSYLVVRLPDTVVAKSVIYKGKEVALKPLNTTFNGLLEYLADVHEALTVNQTVNVEVVLYDEVGYLLPHDAILDRNGKSYVLTIIDDHAQAKEVKIVAKGEQGVVVEKLSASKKIVVAKPDILLKLLSGISVKVKEQ